MPLSYLKEYRRITNYYMNMYINLINPITTIKRNSSILPQFRICSTPLQFVI